MEVRLWNDLIKDNRGNYYTAVNIDGRELTLVNALVERSYMDVLEFGDNFQREFAVYERQFIGKIATDRLRHDIVFAMNGEGGGKLYALDQVSRDYQVTFIDTIEFYRNPRNPRESE